MLLVLGSLLPTTSLMAIGRSCARLESAQKRTIVVSGFETQACWVRRPIAVQDIRPFLSTRKTAKRYLSLCSVITSRVRPVESQTVKWECGCERGSMAGR